MNQERLNHITVLRIYQDGLDTVDLQKLTSDFISANEYRRILCLVISKRDIADMHLETIYFIVAFTTAGSRPPHI